MAQGLRGNSIKMLETAIGNRLQELARHFCEEAGADDCGGPVLENTMGCVETIPLPSFTVMN